jgi:hypothetical protein
MTQRKAGDGQAQGSTVVSSFGGEPGGEGGEDRLPASFVRAVGCRRRKRMGREVGTGQQWA